MRLLKRAVKTRRGGGRAARGKAAAAQAAAAPAIIHLKIDTDAMTPTMTLTKIREQALARVERAYPFRPSGVFMTVAYGIPYFEGLPGGFSGSLVRAHMPNLAAEPERPALEEAVPGPTDVSPENPGITKQRFNVPVQIESNDMLLTLRSDSSEILDDVLSWLTEADTTLAGVDAGGSGLGELLQVTSRRLMFMERGLPRTIAQTEALPYAEMVNPASPMWMGFVSQQVSGSGPPPVVTFLGNSSARMALL